ncbi:aldo/keto reductase [Ktedonobacter racemifer]|uniref:Aldo/keto reductase n=1 Tax=Ktedonobacter racemifer DSM 44963 TaxID=485913 RepID=D6TS62_KTERA|nr:aldo/keto reductase [Ktedonobacter racemifer]EFH86135.1 aldo/keto reductase [Ktedonobacter racemifer DSM 44963]
MPLNAYITFGTSGLRVSPFALGTMTFGEEWGWGSSVADAEAILTHYLELGGNFIDTANSYTDGHAEKIIGDFLAKARVRRDRLVLATKFFFNQYPGDPNGGGASRKAIMEQCEQSLRRLQTDYIDLYWLHNWDRFTPIEETMRALDDLVTAGKIRYIGLDCVPAWKVAQAQTIAHFRGWSPIVAVQLEYSLRERTVEGELIPMAQELGLAVAPWSPLNNGVLTGKYTRQNAGTAKGRGQRMLSLTEKDYELLDTLGEIAHELGTTIAAVALAWVQGRPGVTSTIIGARTLRQLDENLTALDLQLSPAHVAALDKLSEPTLNFPSQNIRTLSLNGSHAGATVNGIPSTLLFPSLLNNEKKRY